MKTLQYLFDFCLLCMKITHIFLGGRELNILAHFCFGLYYLTGGTYSIFQPPSFNGLHVAQRNVAL